MLITIMSEMNMKKYIYQNNVRDEYEKYTYHDNV